MGKKIIYIRYMGQETKVYKDYLKKLFP